MSHRTPKRTYCADRILKERKGQYFIDWEGCDANGDPWEPTWEPKRNANAALVAEWAEEKARRFTKAQSIKCEVKDEDVDVDPVREVREGGIEPSGVSEVEDSMDLEPTEGDEEVKPVIASSVADAVAEEAPVPPSAPVGTTVSQNEHTSHPSRFRVAQLARASTPFYPDVVVGAARFVSPPPPSPSPSPPPKRTSRMQKPSYYEGTRAMSLSHYQRSNEWKRQAKLRSAKRDATPSSKHPAPAGDCEPRPEEKRKRKKKPSHSATSALRVPKPRPVPAGTGEGNRSQ